MDRLSDTAERLINLITVASDEDEDQCERDIDTISFRIKKLAEVLKEETDCPTEKGLAIKCLQWYDEYQKGMASITNRRNPE